MLLKRTPETAPPFTCADLAQWVEDHMNASYDWLPGKPEHPLALLTPDTPPALPDIAVQGLTYQIRGHLQRGRLYVIRAEETIVDESGLLKPHFEVLALSKIIGTRRAGHGAVRFETEPLWVKPEFRNLPPTRTMLGYFRNGIAARSAVQD